MTDSYVLTGQEYLLVCDPLAPNSLTVDWVSLKLRVISNPES